ncbi:MAG: hypothetical protein EOP86_18850 [Verrucomicrobiaceae bacterium]|nr:MAG: hypothetical protein EOP86_18850 [Verrucomicrobiaceae bacterium]
MTSLQINPAQITSLERDGNTLHVRMSDRSEIIVEGWEEPMEALATQLSRSMVEILQGNCTARIISGSGAAAG